MPQPEAMYDAYYLLPAEERRATGIITSEHYRQVQHKARKVAAEVRATTPPEWTWLHGKNLG